MAKASRKGPRANGAAAVRIVHAENLAWLAGVPDGSFDLVYVDPPFNTGSDRRERRLSTVRDDAGDRTGFGGRRYRTIVRGEMRYPDRHDDYLAFLRPRLEEARRVLAARGSLFVHLDPRESHYVKVLLDEVFGRDAFQNQIVWAYDYGARSKSRWSAKHDRDPVVRAHPGAGDVQLRRDRPHPVPRAGPRRSREGGARQDADRRVVEHDRQPDRQGAHGLSDAEAAGDPAPHRRVHSRPASACSTSSPAAARPARPASSSAGAACSSTSRRPRSRSCAGGWRRRVPSSRSSGPPRPRARRERARPARARVAARLPRAADDHAPEIVAERLALAARAAGRELPHLAGRAVPPASARGNAENLIGFAQVPLGLAGPLRADTTRGAVEVYVPLATNEGALIASHSRGMRLLAAGGGARSRVRARGTDAGARARLRRRLGGAAARPRSRARRSTSARR
jgi:hypothetical protein